MLTRIITGIVGGLIIIPACYFSHTWVFPALVAFLCFMGVIEMLRCVGQLKDLSLSVPLITLAVLSPLGARFLGLSDFLILYSGIVFFILVYSLSLAVFSKGKIGLDSVCIAYTMSVYIVTAFSSFVLIRDSYAGQFLYLLAFIAPWSCDIFAYFAGRAFGKHKLIPDVSPKKTVEGSIGGTVACMLCCVGFAFIVRDSISNIIPWGYVIFAVGGLLLAIISQAGDLIASMVKRRYGVKDYGKLLPGHGGVMDRFDSVLVSCPMILLISVILETIAK